MKGEIKREMERRKNAIREFIECLRKNMADIEKYLEDEDWEDLRLEAEDAISRLIWLSQDAFMLHRLEILSVKEHEEKD